LIFFRAQNQIALCPLPVFDQHQHSDLPWAFRLLCTFLRANTREDSQADPSKTILSRLVAFLLYFGFPNSDCLRCCDRLSMSGHHAWLRSCLVEAPQLPARARRHLNSYRRAESEKETETPKCLNRRPLFYLSVQNLRTSPVARRMWRILDEQDCRPSWGFVRQRSTWG